MQKYGQKWRFFGEQKARYPMFAVAGMWIFIMLLTHDGQIYAAIASGNADGSALDELYFPQWSDLQGTQIAQVLFAGIILMIGYAIFVKIAQHKLARISYSV